MQKTIVHIYSQPTTSLSSPRGVACGERGDSLVLRALCGSLGVILALHCKFDPQIMAWPMDVHGKISTPRNGTTTMIIIIMMIIIIIITINIYHQETPHLQLPNHKQQSKKELLALCGVVLPRAEAKGWHSVENGIVFSTDLWISEPEIYSSTSGRQKQPFKSFCMLFTICLDPKRRIEIAHHPTTWQNEILTAGCIALTSKVLGVDSDAVPITARAEALRFG